MNKNPNRTKLYALIFSGATDAILGTAILLIGFGFLPIDLSTLGVPQWMAWLAGGALFISGTWIAVYNYSRLDE